MTKYIAKLAGKIIGTRTTKGRTYTHALIVQDVEEVARNAAYNYVSNSTDSSNFEFSSFIAKQQPGVLCRPRGWSIETKFKAAEIVAAHELVEGGFDAYVRRLRERHINGFETRKANGGFEPYVATWCGRLDLAQKAVAAHTSAARQLIAIVPVEEVSPLKALRTAVDRAIASGSPVIVEQPAKIEDTTPSSTYVASAFSFDRD